MPWQTPTLKTVRMWTRDFVTSALGAAAIIPNSGLRIMSDAMSGLAHLTMLYIDWLSKQLLPDTAETEWLDRHANIWLKNADGSKGRKQATFASGTVTLTGILDIPVPAGTQIGSSSVCIYVTTEDVTLFGTTPVPVSVIATTAGKIGNLEAGETLSLTTGVAGADAQAVVVLIDGGTDTETDAELRFRVLERIQNPPMGGDAHDYVQWALAVSGVTRAWSYPNEMGIGTITTRFLMDNLRSGNHGIPLPADLVPVIDYIDSTRPVTAKDSFIEAPIPYLYSITISELDNDNSATRAAIQSSLAEMERIKSRPGQTIFREWISEAISTAAGVNSFELTFTTLVPPGNGYMPLIDTITYA